MQTDNPGLELFTTATLESNFMCLGGQKQPATPPVVVRLPSLPASAPSPSEFPNRNPRLPCRSFARRSDLGGELIGSCAGANLVIEGRRKSFSCYVDDDLFPLGLITPTANNERRASNMSSGSLGSYGDLPLENLESKRRDDGDVEEGRDGNEGDLIEDFTNTTDSAERTSMEGQANSISTSASTTSDSNYQSGAARASTSLMNPRESNWSTSGRDEGEAGEQSSAQGISDILLYAPFDEAFSSLNATSGENNQNQTHSQSSFSGYIEHRDSQPSSQTEQGGGIENVGSSEGGNLEGVQHGSPGNFPSIVQQRFRRLLQIYRHQLRETLDPINFTLVYETFYYNCYDWDDLRLALVGILPRDVLNEMWIEWRNLQDISSLDFADDHDLDTK